jgi:hypothetical protein
MPKKSDKSKTRLTALAQLVQLYAECKGITSTTQLAELTGYDERSIRRAKADIDVRGHRCPGIDVQPGHRVQGQPRARAYKESPSEINIISKNKKGDPFGLNMYEQLSDYQLSDAGIPTIVNGSRSEWVERFGSEDALELALIEAARNLNTNSRIPLAARVQAELARLVRLKTERQADRGHRNAKDERKARAGEALARRFARDKELANG